MPFATQNPPPPDLALWWLLPALTLLLCSLISIFASWNVNHRLLIGDFKRQRIWFFLKVVLLIFTGAFVSNALANNDTIFFETVAAIAIPSLIFVEYSFFVANNQQSAELASNKAKLDDALKQISDFVYLEKQCNKALSFRSREIDTLLAKIKQKLGDKKLKVGPNELKRLANIRRGLDPNGQQTLLSQIVFEFFSKKLSRDLADEIQVSLFKVVDDEIFPIYSTDGTMTDSVLEIFESHRKEFKLNNVTGNFAVWALNNKNAAPQIVNDATTADISEECPFYFYDASQRANILSMLVMPIKQFGKYTYVFCVDANQKEFFLSRPTYVRFMKLLGPRLYHESCLERMMSVFMGEKEAE